MAVLTVRDATDEVHRALRVRAAQHGRSAEAEVREILSAALIPTHRIRSATPWPLSAATSESPTTTSPRSTACATEAAEPPVLP